MTVGWGFDITQYLMYLIYCMKFQGTLMNQNWENDKKPSFGTDFGPFGPNLDSKTFFINFTLTIW